MTRTYRATDKQEKCDIENEVITKFHRFSETPDKWCYDERTNRLLMLFIRNGVKYLLTVTAKLSRDFGGIMRFAVTDDGTEFELWTDNMSLPRKTVKTA